MTIVIWVEGDSDKAALEGLLRLATAQCERKGFRPDINVGGGTKLLRNIGKFAAADFQDGADYVFALADLHEKDSCPDATRTRLREAVHKVIEDQKLRERFRPHVAVPEMEAWLLCDPTALPQARVGSPRLPTNPEALGPGKAKELLDDFLEKARGQGHGYKGTADAGSIASHANPDLVAQTCAHFRDLVEDLARCAGITEGEQ